MTNRIEFNATYSKVAAIAQPFDVVSFSYVKQPPSIVSEGIKLVTRCKVTHVGLVVKVIGGRVLVVESTIWKDPQTGKSVSGAQLHYLDEIVSESYNTAGSCGWLLSLDAASRASADPTKLEVFVQRLIDEHSSYDVKGLFHYALQWLIGPEAETTRTMYCSACDTAVLENCGLKLHRDWSATSPADLIRMQIFQGEPLQFFGPPTVMDGRFNTI